MSHSIRYSFRWSLVVALASPLSFANAETDLTQPRLKETYVTREVVGLRPHIGVLDFQAAGTARRARAMIGAVAEFNFADRLLENPTRAHIGIQSGFLFSQVGGANSNFVNADSGASVAVIPANIKLGYSITPGARLSLHGGGNIMYRSLPATVVLGGNTKPWSVFPNIGADVDLDLGKSVALTLRPDFTFAGAQTVVAASVGLGFIVD